MNNLTYLNTSSRCVWKLSSLLLADGTALPDSNISLSDACAVLEGLICYSTDLLATGSSNCVAICPNPDLTGIGVRVAFYFSSVVTALLVLFSPGDSVASAWAGTLLTTSVTIAAFVQKATGQLTLHHASLVLNLSTLSCISSLAVAPTLPIWQLDPVEYAEREHANNALTLDSANSAQSITQELINDATYRNAHKEQARAAQVRARVVLSLAILLQIVAQWTWAIFLFVSPHYSQTECNATTTLVMFLITFTTQDVNSFRMNRAWFLVWPLWLLFCTGVTFALMVVLAVSGSFRANEVLPSQESISTNTPTHIAWINAIIESLPYGRPRRWQVVFVVHSFSFFVWTVLVIASEWQISINSTILTDDNSVSGLGQISALCVSIAPLWSLCVALYKYPALRRRRRRHRQKHQQEHNNRSASVALRARRPGPYVYVPRHLSDASDEQGYEMHAAGASRRNTYTYHAYAQRPSKQSCGYDELWTEAYDEAEY